MIKEIKGNILDTHCKLIAHGVNCQGVMGSGVAKALYEKWPEVKEDYLAYVNNYKTTADALLGRVVPIKTTDNKIVYNCFTQQNYGYDGKQVYLSYEALHEVLLTLLICIENRNETEIAIPKIGCGLAGGNWEKVKELIETVFKDSGITVNVYYLEE